jgi:cell division septation protein DedD
MAKRDFAQTQSRAKKADKGRMPAVMAAASLLLTAILAFAGGYMVGDKQHSTSTLQAEKAVLQARIDTQQKRIAVLEQQLAVNAHEKPAAKKAATEQVGDLTFYSKLPKEKVMPSPLGDTGPPAKEKQQGENIDQYADLPPPADHSRLPIPAPPPPADGHKADVTTGTPGSQANETATVLPGFSLQLASFTRRSDADALLARMQKAGIKGSIAEANVKGVGARFRVLAGPYAGMAEAEGMRATVRQKLGINPMLRRD